MPRRKATKEELEHALYDLKLNIPEIANQFGYKPASIWKALKYRDIPYPNYFTGAQKLTELQREFIVGTLMGDAHIPKQGRFIRIAQSIKQKNYVIWKADIMKGWLSPKGVYLENRIVNGKTYQLVRFNTVTHDDFSFYENLFYKPPSHKKIITLEALDLITPFALAVWFMDDGSCLPKKGIRLHTAGFSWDENYLIQDWFASRFNLRCTVAKISRGYPVLTFYSSSAKEFRELVRPHLLPDFLYKIDF